MFAPVRSIAGSSRLYPVKDRVVVQQILDATQRVSKNPTVHSLQRRDLHKLDVGNTVVALNPAGRQMHICLSSLGGRCASFLVHARSGTVELVPLRFAKSVHDANTVLKCTVCTTHRLLIVNDICGHDGPVSERVRAVHDLVHSKHVPDAALFPMRVVARRCFSLSQLPELKEFVARSDVRYHSLSLISSQSATEYRMQLSDRPMLEHRACAGPLQPVIGAISPAEIVAANGPDAYKIRMESSGPWQFLSVKTIEESAALAQADLREPRICQVTWDGSGWRFVMAAPASGVPQVGAVA